MMPPNPTLPAHARLRIGVARLVFALIIPVLACEKATVAPTRLAPADLSGQDFSSSALNHVDFSGKNLDGASFAFSEIQGSDFTDATLLDADLSNAFASHADFTRADLRSANLEGAVVDEADFTQADLRGASLNVVCGLETAIWIDAQLDVKWALLVATLTSGIKTLDFQGDDLSYVCFSDIELAGANFRGANLEQAAFFRIASDLHGADFEGAILRHADLYKANLRGANLMGTILEGADLTYAVLTGARYDAAILLQAKLSCTRLANGDLYNSEACYGTPPPP